MTSTSSQHDTNWYLDIGSTNHLTNNFSNLYVRSEPYLGNNQIHVNDMASLPIKNIGFTTLSTPTNSFILNKLLHVPQIRKNLISVSQFTSDNNVNLEFHFSSFLLKDQATRRVLLLGTPKDNLYIFLTSMSPINHPQTYLSQRAPFDVWHCRMGHPSYQIIRHLVSKFYETKQVKKLMAINTMFCLLIILANLHGYFQSLTNPVSCKFFAHFKNLLNANLIVR